MTLTGYKSLNLFTNIILFFILFWRIWLQLFRKQCHCAFSICRLSVRPSYIRRQVLLRVAGFIELNNLPFAPFRVMFVFSFHAIFFCFKDIVQLFLSPLSHTNFNLPVAVSERYAGELAAELMFFGCTLLLVVGCLPADCSEREVYRYS